MYQNMIKDQSSETNKEKNKRYKQMNYIEILENYEEYPSKNGKFKYNGNTVNNKNAVKSTLGLNNKIPLEYIDYSEKEVKFIQESEKADEWQQNYSRNMNHSQYLLTSLHFLPEHLWDSLSYVYHENKLVGYKCKDNCINFFVHLSELDDTSKTLRSLLRNKFDLDKEKIKDILKIYNKRKIESWLTLRAKKYLENDESDN